MKDAEAGRALQTGDTGEAALLHLVADCLTAFDAELADVMASDDPAGPHKARVAMRRLTTCLDAFAPILREKSAANFRAEAKRLFRLLGRLRDSDVHLAARRDEPGHDKRLAANDKLRRQTRSALRDDHADTLAPRLLAALDKGTLLRRRNALAQALQVVPVTLLAEHALAEAWAVCLAHGAGVMAGKPEQVHGFRKDIKTFRYLAEFFAPLFSELARASFNADLRSLQDALGSLNDQIVVARMAGDKSVSPDPEMQRETARAAEVWARMSRNLAPWRGDQPTLRP